MGMPRNRKFGHIVLTVRKFDKFDAAVLAFGTILGPMYNIVSIRWAWVFHTGTSSGAQSNFIYLMPQTERRGSFYTDDERRSLTNTVSTILTLQL